MLTPHHLLDEESKNAVLAQCRMFGAFAKETRAAMAARLRPCAYKAGSIVCMKGDEADCLYIIADGNADVTVSSADGRVMLLGTFSRGDVFGELGLFDGAVRLADVSARTDLQLYKLSASDFELLLTQCRVSELRGLLSYVCDLLRRVTNNLEDTTFMDAGARIAHKIRQLYLSDHKYKSTGATGSITLKISQKDLGQMAGLSREATNKALSDIEARGLIKKHYRKITVTDIAAFEAVYGDHCEC